jgi:hypothetical protein
MQKMNTDLRINHVNRRKWLLFGAVVCFSLSAVQARSAEFNPAYPRIAARPHGTLLSSSAVDADSRHIAKHHVAILATHRTWKVGGFDMATLPGHIKSYNPNVQLFKYMNFNQLGDGGDNSNQDWIRKKLESESGANGRGDWWKRTAAGSQIVGFTAGKYQINVTRQTKPDRNGLHWPQWFVRYWNASPNESGDWVAPGGYAKGRGLKEGDWDGVYLDSQFLSTSVFAPSNADYNTDRLTDPPKEERTRNWVADGQESVVNEWKKVQPSRFVLGQYGNLTSANEDPSPLKGVHDGGLIQNVTARNRQKGGWPLMMKQYRSGMNLAGGPKIVIFHNQLKDLLDANSGMSVYQANRYGMTSALMDNGYYAVLAPGQVRPEFDEFFGGKDHSVSKLGYLGYPKSPPQVNSWSQGVYRREFDKGLVLVNPKGNGTQTVNVGSGWRRIDGSQDRIHNNGQNASTVTLKEQDGIILIRASSNN